VYKSRRYSLCNFLHLSVIYINNNVYNVICSEINERECKYDVSNPICAVQCITVILTWDIWSCIEHRLYCTCSGTLGLDQLAHSPCTWIIHASEQYRTRTTKPCDLLSKQFNTSMFSHLSYLTVVSLKYVNPFVKHSENYRIWSYFSRGFEKCYLLGYRAM
jgi:hypothetical protein